VFKRLQTKLTVLYAGLFGVALTLIAAAVLLAITANAERQVRGELVAGGAVFDRLWAMRSSDLENDAGLMTRDFGFREAMASHDGATAQSALENLRQRSGVDVALSVTLDGQTAASDGHSLGADGAAIAQAVQTDTADVDPAGVAVIGGAPYQAIATPILSPTLMGWVVFAQKLDRREMSALEGLSSIPLHAQVLERGADGWISAGEPLSGADTRRVSRFVSDALANHAGPQQLSMSDGAAIALVKPLKTLDGAPSAVLLLRYPMAMVMAPYRLLMELLVGIGLAGMALAVAGSWALARSVTRPVSALVAAAQRLQQGEAAQVVVETGDEVGRLGESFNLMAEAIGERERRITHLAMSDAETGLPNRLALERRLATAADAQGALVAALSIDRFAMVRGVIGYELAGALVRHVAARLAVVAPGAAIGRLSSDTLGMVFRAADGAAAAEMMARAVDGPMQVGDATIDVSVTIGVAGSRQPDPDRSPFVAAAIAVAQARTGHRRVAAFDPEAYGDPAANLSLMSQMMQAIEAGHIEVFYQPKFDIRRGCVGALEALVRWRHPQRGLIGPDLFIPLAEETGHIRALTDRVLAQAIADQQHLRAAKHDLDISVNISGRLLSDTDFADAALRVVGSAPGRIWFEITETAVIDNPEEALRQVERFADAGIGVSIDDYGSGLSSLAYLREIRAEELKIDKAFILDLAASRKNTLLVRSTIDLAHSLGMKVTAEGVETNEAFALLAGMGCDYAQGFLIERPLPLKDVLTFLHEDRAAARRYG
jgi:EAL domain-containing protein (putative c-di-GMP-specific phosphodiesterase class I)/GGDEF domain-containing protein